MSIYIYKSNQGNITKNVCRSFLFVNVLMYRTLQKRPHLTFMLMCLHPSNVKYSLEFRPVFSALRVTAARPVRPATLLLALHLLLIVILLVPPLSLVRQLLVPMSQDTEGSLSPDITGLIISLVSQLSDDPFVDLDNQFADVLATESVVEDSHDVSEGSISPVIGEMSSTQCSS